MAATTLLVKSTSGRQFKICGTCGAWEGSKPDKVIRHYYDKAGRHFRKNADG